MLTIVKNTETGELRVSDTAEQTFKNWAASAPEEWVGGQVAYAEDLLELPLSAKDLVQLYNSYTGKDLVKFQNKRDAATRTYEAMTGIQGNKTLFKGTLPWAETTKKSTTRKRTSKGTQLEPRPADQILPCRAGTRQAFMVDALTQGVTLDDLVGGYDGLPLWKEASARAGLNWDIHAVKGYGVRTELIPASELEQRGIPNRASVTYSEGQLVPVYFLVLPKGMTSPKPHTPKKEA